MLRLLFVLFVIALATTSSAASDERAKLVGTWKLTSIVTEFQASGEKRPLLGNNPRGYAVFTPEGRLMVVITGDGRKPGQTSDERAALLTTMLAYTGKYSVEADRLITKVDASWNEAWAGTDQVRFFKVDGNRLDAMTGWAPSAALPEKPMVRGVVSFEREK
jgi:hypothetical protein